MCPEMDMRVRALKLLAKGLNAVCSESRDGHACTRAETVESGHQSVGEKSRDGHACTRAETFFLFQHSGSLSPEMDMRVRALKHFLPFFRKKPGSRDGHACTRAETKSRILDIVFQLSRDGHACTRAETEQSTRAQVQGPCPEMDMRVRALKHLVDLNPKLLKSRDGHACTRAETPQQVLRKSAHVQRWTCVYAR